MEERIVIADELRAFLSGGSIDRVYVAEGHLAPLPLAYVVNFPRLSAPLDGCHQMEIEQNGRTFEILPGPGEVVLEPPNCWNRPSWTRPVKVLTFLFGRKQTGVSLVDHDGVTSDPPGALKTAFSAPIDGPAPKVLGALLDVAVSREARPMSRLLVESLLHCCLDLLEAPRRRAGGKTRHLFENLCLYIQENFQNPITRDGVARHFRISPGHLSRVFKEQGSMSFSYYLTLVRIDRAKFMLKRFNMTLDEIAAGCGFAETAYFCRVFKKNTKVRPTEYRLRGL